MEVSVESWWFFPIIKSLEDVPVFFIIQLGHHGNHHRLLDGDYEWGKLGLDGEYVSNNYMGCGCLSDGSGWHDPNLDMFHPQMAIGTLGKRDCFHQLSSFLSNGDRLT